MCENAPVSPPDCAAAARGSLWAVTASPARVFPELAVVVRAEAVVIGGGFTGLSAALHLAQAGTDVVLLEAGQPGWGASGRNGGQVIPGLKLDLDALEAQLGAGAVAATSSAADLLFSLIERHAIPCDARRCGWIQVAENDAQARIAGERVAQWQRRGAPVIRLDKRQVLGLTGASGLSEGWLDERGGSVQPLSLARGLAEVASRLGARIYGSSRAIRIGRIGTGWRVETGAGAVEAQTVLIGTNGYTDRLWPGLAKSVVPLYSMQIATDPLPHEVRRQVLPGGQTVADMRKLVRYFRLDRDGRFVIGSRGPETESPAASDTKFLERAARALYPCLADLSFRYRWAGRVAMTRNHLPYLSRLAPGVYAAAGYNGRGVAMANLMGKLLAALATGAEETELGLPVRPPRKYLLHGLHRPMVRAVIGYHRLRDAFA